MQHNENRKAGHMTKPLLTAAELARHYKVNRTTIWRWEKQGIVKGVKIGGAKRYKQPEK